MNRIQQLTLVISARVILLWFNQAHSLHGIVCLLEESFPKNALRSGLG